MLSLVDRIPAGVEPMLQDLETYIVQSGLDDMKANAEIITTVTGGGPCNFRSSAMKNLSPSSLSLTAGFGKVRGGTADSVQ